MNEKVICQGCGKTLAVYKDKGVYIQHRRRQILVPYNKTNSPVCLITCETCRTICTIFRQKVLDKDNM